MFGSEEWIYKSSYRCFGQLCTHTSYSRSTDDVGVVTKTEDTQSLYGKKISEVENSMEDSDVRVGDEIWVFEGEGDAFGIKERDRITDSQGNNYTVIRADPVKGATTLFATRVWMRGDA